VTQKQAERQSVAPAGPVRRKARKPRRLGFDSWRLPSGVRLADFALTSGFLVPPLMEDDRENRHGRKNDL
jgi:hypothetical protein